VRPDHPPAEALALWALEPDSADLDETWRRHLEAGCAACRARAEELRRLDAALARALGTSAPAIVRERAYGVLRAEGLSDTNILVASLIEDASALAGVRDETATERFLLYRAGPWDVQLRLAPRDGDRSGRILGHLEGPADRSVEGIEVRAVHGDRVLATAVTDDLGEFAMDSRTPSPLFLEIRSPDLLIRTPPVLG
jgi:hypothetical protein